MTDASCCASDDTTAKNYYVTILFVRFIYNATYALFQLPTHLPLQYLAKRCELFYILTKERWEFMNWSEGAKWRQRVNKNRSFYYCKRGRLHVDLLHLWVCLTWCNAWGMLQNFGCPFFDRPLHYHRLHFDRISRWNVL